MPYGPFDFEAINRVEGSFFPSAVKPCNNVTYRLWVRNLIQKAQSVIELKNLPKQWVGDPKDFFWLCLFRLGYVAAWKTEKFGPIFQPCGLTGQSVYYQPTKATVSNPALGDVELEIGKDCELIKLTPDYMGIWDLITRTAERLSTLDVAIDMSIVNNKVPFIMGAKSKPMAAMIKKIMDKINRGEPTVVFDEVFSDTNSGKQLKTSDNPFSVFDREHLKNSYITTDQLKDAQTILNQFYNEIGIPTVPYQKMERMVNEEAQSQKVASSARLAVWLDCLTDSFDKYNDMFGTDIKVVPRFLTEEGESNELSESNDNRL